MSYVNSLHLVGNLGGDPEIKNVGNSVVTTFSVATTETWKDKSTGEKKSNTDWHNCVAWGHTADFISKYAKKGNKVIIQGSIHYKTYENKDGIKVTKPEIKVARYDGFQIIDKAEADVISKKSNDINFATKYKNKVADDDNIPF